MSETSCLPFTCPGKPECWVIRHLDNNLPCLKSSPKTVLNSHTNNFCSQNQSIIVYLLKGNSVFLLKDEVSALKLTLPNSHETLLIELNRQDVVLRNSTGFLNNPYSLGLFSCHCSWENHILQPSGNKFYRCFICL